MLVYALVWAPLLAAAVALTVRWPVRGLRDGGRLLLHTTVLFAAPFVWGTASYALCLWLAPGWQPLGFARMYRTTGHSVLYVYSVFVLICHVLLDIRRRYADERAALETVERAAKARLQVLAMELQPHFVGNALHSVAALLDESPRRAADALCRLRHLLARAMEADRRAEVPLCDEIAMLRWYTDTQELRFADRLRIEWAVDVDVLDATVPTLLLQPLVENAIKFSVEAADRVGTVRIVAVRREGHLVIRVHDDGVGIGGAARSGQGIGLANVRERLRWLYGPAGSVNLTRDDSGQGTVVEVTIPFRHAPDDHSAPERTSADPRLVRKSGPARRLAPRRTRETALDANEPEWMRPALRRREIWTGLLTWALTFGTAAWTLDAIVAAIAPAEPLARWYGAGRLVQAVLVVPALAVAFETAERWPVRSWRDTRRLLGQLGIAIGIGPIWGTIAYWLNPALALWNDSVGRWGVIAIEAKGVLFAYGTYAVLAHVVLRAQRQRARELRAHALRADLIAARVQAVTLGMHTERVTAALDTVLARLPEDTTGVTEILVGVSEAIAGALALTRTDFVALRDVLALADAHAALVIGMRPHDVFRWSASNDALEARVPPMAVWPEIAHVVHQVATAAAGVSTAAVRVSATLGAPTHATAWAHVERTDESHSMLVLHVEESPREATRSGRVVLRIPLSAAAA